MTTAISAVTLQRAFTYREYRKLLDDLFAEGKTTGDNQSPAMLQYAKMSLVRMRRLDKTVRLSDSLREVIHQLNPELIWLVLTEGWCGDAGQSIPVMQKIAEASNGRITLKLILRDENPSIMDAHLTNGARSIPKLICLKKDTLQELGTWGPRPAPVQQMLLDFKKNPEGVTKEELGARLQKWYNDDKTLTIQEEFESLLKGVSAL